MKTIFFERAFNTKIEFFKTIEDIDKFIERKRGRKLRVVEIATPLVPKRGSIFRIRSYNIDKIVDEVINAEQ